MTLSIFDSTALDEHARKLRIDRDQIRRLRNSWFKHARSEDVALDEISLEHRHELVESIQFHTLELIERRDSIEDGATKLAFRAMDDGALVEAVILRNAKGRTSLCVSSQVGCAAACRFCATGYMGLKRNLRGEEIADQLALANRLLADENRLIRNVVFMGMGEPFHNSDAVTQAVEILRSPKMFNLEDRRILVSTVGIPSAMVRFARRFPRVGLALSLHSARARIRDSLIPLSRVHSIEELRKACLEIAAIQNRPPMIEYLLIAELNDSESDAKALIEFLDGLSPHVNLIPYNTIPDAPDLKRCAQTQVDRFTKHLRDSGLGVTTRHSLGQDISAACGQLVRQSTTISLTGDRG